MVEYKVEFWGEYRSYVLYLIFFNVFLSEEIVCVSL